ncbi:MAG: O-antigen ligase family protein, partial [Bacteroidales bacterium]|nr:O-antigen ligase family protein [Bacteroidales bacterium]
MSPFFRDHTIYGATIALFIPPVLAIAIGSKTWNLSKLISLFFLSLLMFALVYSYTRAAWLSLFGALGVYLLIKLKIKFKYLAISGIIILLLSFSFWSSIYFQLQNNQQDSSGDFSEHVESMANIATDASNLERINRWKAAIRLFAEKPVLGWGPGTYQFQYSQFQFSYDKTIISTNFGDGGNAHSEYLGALSETGLIGAIVYILIIIFTLKTGILAYYQCNDEKLKLILLGVLLGLLTYYLHSVLNNYLDTDKISIPFWTFTAMIVRLDVFSLENVKKEH